MCVYTKSQKYICVYTTYSAVVCRYERGARRHRRAAMRRIGAPDRARIAARRST
jgi:hypothetical protein